MRAKLCGLGILGSAILLATPSRVLASLPGDDPASQKVENSKTTKTEKKPGWTDAGHVSTADAVRSAAKEEAKQTDPNKKEETKEPDSAVDEFHPAPPGEAASGDSSVKAKETKKAPLKDVHGTVYGAAGPADSGNRATGGAVGASSKSKKTHVYVETDRSRTTPPH